MEYTSAQLRNTATEIGLMEYTSAKVGRTFDGSKLGPFFGERRVELRLVFSDEPRPPNLDQPLS
jgi:hypothetical protein